MYAEFRYGRVSLHGEIREDGRFEEGRTVITEDRVITVRRRMKVGVSLVKKRNIEEKCC